MENWLFRDVCTGETLFTIYSRDMNDEVLNSAGIVWDYLQLNSQAGPADCLLVLGSRDERVAEYATQLATTYSYNHILITGGVAHHNDLLRTDWQESTEAEHFAAIMRQSGYNGSLLLETKAINTGQNALYSFELLKMQHISLESIVIVTKPYMERRARATFDAQWPDAECSFLVTSPTYKNLIAYCTDELTVDETINIMVGDLQRIIEYPRFGYQSPQIVSEPVTKAFMHLKRVGFTKHLIK